MEHDECPKSGRVGLPSNERYDNFRCHGLRCAQRVLTENVDAGFWPGNSACRIGFAELCLSRFRGQAIVKPVPRRVREVFVPGRRAPRPRQFAFQGHPGSRRAAMVVPQQPAEFQLTLDRSIRNRKRFPSFVRARRQCPIIPSLMRPVLVIKGFVLFDNMPQMLDAEAHKVIQTLPANRLHEALGVRILIRCSRAYPFQFQTIAFQCLPELLGKLRVHVQNQYLRSRHLLGEDHRHVPCLLHDPSFIRVCCDPGDVNAATPHMDEKQNKHVDQSRCRPDFLREEVARPQRFSVSLHKLAPRAFASLGARIEAMLLQDRRDGRSRHGDPQFDQFSPNPRRAPTRLFGKPQHQVSDLQRRFRTTRLPRGRRRFRIALLIHPAKKRSRRDDRHQFLDRRPIQALSQLQQPPSLRSRDRNSPRQLFTQDPILFLEKLNVPGQFPVRHRRQIDQQRLQQSAHGHPCKKADYEGMTEFSYSADDPGKVRKRSMGHSRARARRISPHIAQPCVCEIRAELKKPHPALPRRHVTNQ